MATTTMARKGKIRFQAGVYDELFPQVAAHLEFAPYNVDYDFYANEVVVVGQSPMFDLLPPGKIIPYYTITVTQDDTGAVDHVEMKRET